jgi:hypothetical protein
VTSLLILLRTVFRLAESAQGRSIPIQACNALLAEEHHVGFFGYASTHESLFGCLEYLPVILVLGVWSGLPPSRFLGGDGGQAKDGGDEKGMVAEGCKCMV